MVLMTMMMIIILAEKEANCKPNSWTYTISTASWCFLRTLPQPFQRPNKFSAAISLLTPNYPLSIEWEFNGQKLSLRFPHMSWIKTLDHLICEQTHKIPNEYPKSKPISWKMRSIVNSNSKYQHTIWLHNSNKNKIHSLSKDCWHSKSNRHLTTQMQYLPRTAQELASNGQ